MPSTSLGLTSSDFGSSFKRAGCCLMIMVTKSASSPSSPVKSDKMRDRGDGVVPLQTFWQAGYEGMIGA
jgi:hypothetical protein